jgi:DNA-binding transcriptional LysR family regulator
MRQLKITMDGQIAVLAVAEKGSFEAAGKYLGIGRSAVRKRVHSVESEVGTPVFQAIGKAMVPTDAGGIYRAGARESVRFAWLGVDRVQAFVRAQSSELRIGYSSHLSEKLLEIIVRLESQTGHPIVTERESLLTHQVVEKVLRGKLHVGFGFLPLGEPDLLTRRLMEEPLMACLPASHRLGTKHVIALEDVADEPIVAVARTALPGRHDEIVKHFQGQGIFLRFVADAYLPKEALWMVSRGIGIAFMTHSSAASLRSDAVLRPFSDQLLTVKSGVFVRRDHNASHIEEFIETVWTATTGLRLKVSKPKSPKLQRFTTRWPET